MKKIENNSQLFVDISTLAESDAKTGIQRVVRSILLELINNPPKGFCVEPILYRRSEGFYYARNFIQRFLEPYSHTNYTAVVISNDFTTNINDWNSTNGAILAHENSALRITGTGIAESAAEQVIFGFNIGSSYELEIHATSVSGTIDVLLIMSSVWHATIKPTAMSGIHKVRFTATDNHAGLHLRVLGTNDTALFDYVKVREIVGENLIVEDKRISFKAEDIFLGLDLTAQYFPEINSTLEEFKNNGVAINYLVYDLTPLNNIELHSEGMISVFGHWIDSILRYSNKLICISDAVATEVKTWAKDKAYETTPEIDFFHLGADIEASIPIAGIPLGADLILSKLEKKPSFLMVGTIEPRKGVAQVLSAFDQLWLEDVDTNLVLVGREGWNVDEIVHNIQNHPEYGKRLIWLKSISDEYLDKIYSSSAALIAASSAEGFGLPLIEAAMHGTSIIARDLAVFKEVAGEHAFYFSGTTAAALADSVNRWLLLASDNNVPTVSGMKWLTWNESTTDLIKLIVPR